MSTQTKNQTQTHNYNELVSELKNTLGFHLKELFTSFFDNADTALFDLANEASNNEEQKQYFELLHSIRTDKANLSRGLTDALRTYLRPISAITPETDEDDDDDDGELSLVSQETMDEMVLVNSIANKTYDKNSDAIRHLEIRLDFLAEHTPMIFRKNALDPLHFCEAFQQCITILELNTADKLILYKLFNNEVAGNLHILYGKLNKLLIDAGVLPKIKLKAQKNKNGGGASHEPEYEIDEDEADETQGSSGGGSAGGSRGNSSRQGATGGAGNEAASSNNNQPGQAGAGNGNQGQPSEDHERDITEQLIRKYGNRNIGGYPIGRASKIIRDFLGSDSASAGSIEGNPQYYGHKDVLTALNRMQSQTHAEIEAAPAPAPVARINAQAIKQALLSTIASQQGGTITKQISQVIEKTIDFIKLIFDAIIDDTSISDTIKALLLSLQIPVIKASMLDQEFFVNDDHPARELLDKIAELGVGVTEHTDPLYVQLGQIVRELLTQYDNDLNAFVVALNKVKAIIAERESEIETKEREAQEQVQKEHARKIVLWELRKSTLDKKLPSLVHKLVLKLWPTLMFNHYIKHGKQNDDWVFLVTTLGEMIDSVQTPTNVRDFKFLTDNHEALANRVESRLSKSKRAQEHIEEVMRDLRKTYEHLLDTDEFDEALAQPELSTMPVMDTPLAGHEDMEVSDEELEPTEREPHPDEPVDMRAKLQLLPSDVRPGVWFQVTMSENHVRRLKLSVIIMEEALLVFVDHNGERVIEKDAETFAEELKTGKSQLIMHHSVFDHALGNVFNRL